LLTVGDLANNGDFTNEVTGVLGIDFVVTRDCNSLVSASLIFILSGGGLIAIFVGPLLAEVAIFSNLASITGLVTDFSAGLFGGSNDFFTLVPILIFSVLPANGARTIDPVIILEEAFKGDPGDLGDIGGKVFDPEPGFVVSPDFFTAEGNVMMLYNKKILLIK
jgi:hypothetical protein